MLSLYIVFSWLLGLCYGFVLISSAAGQNEANLFQVGQSSVYQYHSTVLLNEIDETSKNVGFFITADITVESKWGLNGDQLLKLQLRTPQLHIRSRKAPSPDGFIQHSSKLDEFSLRPFYVVRQRGQINKIFIPEGEPIALSNLNKGISSLFQFQVLDAERNETDSSGNCIVTYHSTDPNKIEKIKRNCISSTFPYWKNGDVILDTLLTSYRKITYEFDPKLSYLKNVYGKETHQMSLAVRENLGSVVTADQSLTHLRNEKTEPILGETLEEVLTKINPGYIEQSLLTEKEDLKQEESRTFAALVNDLRDNLKDEHYGSVTSGKAFLRLVEAARRSNRDEVAKVLSSKKNKKIYLQILDILGYVQSENIHEAVMKKLHFDEEEHQDGSERYLWSLSMCSQPNPEIIKDLFNRYRKSNLPEKVKETLLLTIASMTRRLKSRDTKLKRNVEEIILNGLDYAKDEQRYAFLRALKNLKSPTSIDTLLQVIKTGTPKEGVLAFKALKAFEPFQWNEKVLKGARRAFFQLDRKYDSSSRTLAADILLESDIRDNLLGDFLFYLKQNETSFEVKQYLFQRLQMMSDEDPDFRIKLSKLIKSDRSLNNYSVLAPRGLSTSLKRNFVRNQSVNGSLLTIQEMFGGIVKRGIVNVMMEKNKYVKEMFSLGIFAGGLSSFVVGEVEGDEESATAGMDLTILDTQIRPFVFFDGQGELMGHVWSGTASEMTPAFQSLILLQDHLEFIRLAPGFVAELNLKGALSFDLSGKVEVSLWNRNAASLVQKSAGIVVNGFIIVDTSFVRSQIEFNASIEPKLILQSDIDFSGNMNLCMMVTQPDSLFRHNTFKIERIPGSKHKLRIAKYEKMVVPGITYALNKKNNDMCSAMFN